MKHLFKKHSEKIKFLLTGIWNTIFGYFSFVALFYLFSEKIHYMILVLISNIISITNSYISYKLYVFKTKGNYLVEYLRFYMVYGGSIVLSLLFLPIFVEIFHIHPLLAMGIILIFTVIISYFGHKHFSFTKGKQ